MSEKLGKNAQKWQEIFDDHAILEQIERSGTVEISADLIRRYREPRLMVKFDHASNVPPVLRDNKISILPVSRGNYVLGRFQVFHRFEDTVTVETKDFSSRLFDSVSPASITSEAVALNYAYSAGIIDDFVGESVLPTVSGRMGSGAFSFRVASVDEHAFTVDVDSAQIEIDAGYEGPSSLILVEAKMALSDDFHIRQLYFPYRAFLSRVSKRVRPIFLTFSNGVYTMSEYAFADPMEYNSIYLVRRARYRLVVSPVEPVSVIERLRSVDPVSAPNLPFPQANSFERVINLLEIAAHESLVKNDIHAIYDFTPRQSDYYLRAGEYVGLLETGADGTIVPTAVGHQILSVSLEERQVLLACQLMKFEPFRLVVFGLIDGVVVSKEQVARSIAAYCSHVDERGRRTHPVGESTAWRRADTVLRWAEWVRDFLL